MSSLNPSTKPIQKVSSALESLAFDSALMALAQIRAEETIPKLGSVQRWVRQAGIMISMESDTVDVYSKKTFEISKGT
jgi:hypothetical protein